MINTQIEKLRSQLAAATLPPDFYCQPTLEVARQLLGKLLLVVEDSQEQDQPGTDKVSNLTGGLIVETEGYVGQEDPACHAYRGRTPRNGVMWDEPGRAYIYFTYGNHWMINVVTERQGFPAAALIRALEPTVSLERMRVRRNLYLLRTAPVKHSDLNLTNGPGKLCQALGIKGELNGTTLNGPRLYICDPTLLDDPTLGKSLPPFEIVESTRIGITRGVDLPWRYYVKQNPYVSRLAKPQRNPL